VYVCVYVCVRESVCVSKKRGRKKLLKILWHFNFATWTIKNSLPVSCIYLSRLIIISISETQRNLKKNAWASLATFYLFLSLFLSHKKTAHLHAKWSPKMCVIVIAVNSTGALFSYSYLKRPTNHKLYSQQRSVFFLVLACRISKKIVRGSYLFKVFEKKTFFREFKVGNNLIKCWALRIFI